MEGSSSKKELESGLTLLDVGEFVEAVEKFTTAIFLAEKDGDEEMRARVSQFLGVALFQLHQVRWCRVVSYSQTLRSFSRRWTHTSRLSLTSSNDTERDQASTGHCLRTLLESAKGSGLCRKLMPVLKR